MVCLWPPGRVRCAPTAVASARARACVREFRVPELLPRPAVPARRPKNPAPPAPIPAPRRQSDVSLASTLGEDGRPEREESVSDTGIKLPPGAQIFKADIAALRPTQLAVGMQQVGRRCERSGCREGAAHFKGAAAGLGGSALDGNRVLLPLQLAARA